MRRVVKVGGRVQSDPRLPAAIAAAWQDAPGTLCLVHGGGDEVSALQRALGIEPAFSGGRRITAERDIDLIRMALSGSANKRLVAALLSAGAPAVGLSGEDGALITAREAGKGTLGRVGSPAAVKATLLEHFLTRGWLPVVSPLSRDADSREGAALNVNGDDAAAAIAVALGAAELLLVADVPGLQHHGATVTALDADEAMQLIADRVAVAGMAAKLQAGVDALHGGVERVRIGDLDAILDPGRGTTLTPSRSLV